jgi:hypothetical protein
MAEETQYTAKNGIAVIATANSNLDGTGTIGSIITAASNGTLIKRLYLKATGNTTEGMIRIYVYDGSNSRIIQEVQVPSITCSGTTPAFETVLELNLTLKSGYILKASTQKAETFNVIAEALDWTYYGASVRTDTTQFTTNNGQSQLSTANSNLNGTGTINDVYTAGSSATYKGSSVKCIVLKDTGTVNDGMVRLFINNGTTKYLFKEVFIPTQMGSDFTPHLEHIIDFGDNDFELQAGYKISASTQNAETYGIEVSISGNDWKYLA